MATRLQRLRHQANVPSAICDACGRHVPSDLLATCEVQGLRGSDICPFCFGPMRFEPSYEDLKRDSPVEIPVPDDDDMPAGSEVYWR